MRRGILAVSGLIGAFVLASGPASAATINVKSDADEFATAGGCTLREAIQSANTDEDGGGCKRKGDGTDDTIVLHAKTEYPITIPGGTEDANETGDWDVASNITIRVSGNGKATLDANEQDRGLDVLSSGKLTASKLVIANGNPPTNGFSYGGAAILNRGRLILSRSKAISNDAVNGQATNGGAINAVANGGKTKLDRVTLDDNHAGNVGGAIAWSAGNLKVTNSVISTNDAYGGGGGITLSGSSPANLRIENTTISGNTDFSDGGNFGGGGIMASYFGGRPIKVTNTTISGNTAYANGGGIWSYTGAVSVNGGTITGNTANYDSDADGRGGGAGGISVSLRNTIIADNEDASLTSPLQDCYLLSLSPAHNYVSPDGGCPTNGSNRVGGPSWGPLADNGGPTPTHKLRKDSQAIGHAGKDAPKTDQRGVTRDSKPDIGAYER